MTEKREIEIALGFTLKEKKGTTAMRFYAEIYIYINMFVYIIFLLYVRQSIVQSFM